MKRNRKKANFRGHFLDLKTLSKALTDANHSLASAGEAFKARERKLEFDAHGTVSPESLNYNRQDVRATVSLLEAERDEFDKHPIPLRGTDVFSPATFPKAYFRKMGITSPMSRMEGITSAQLGAAMAAFHGGRAGIGVRDVVVPVVATDVTAMYPTVYELCRLQEYLTAGTLGSEPSTEEARRTLEAVSSRWLLDPDAWPKLRFLAEVLPEGDELPVRAQYAGRRHGFSTGLNPFWSAEYHWHTGYDLAVSILRTGRQPTIRRAFRIVSKGMIDGLRPVRFRDRVELDPRKPGLFARLVSERLRVKRDSSLGEEERQWLAQGLKVFANAASYGIAVEFNPEALPTGRSARVRVHGIGDGFTAETTTLEKTGRFCFPPTAAFVTSAGRLVLALIEQEVRRRGGVILAMDTDSAHIVATKTGGLAPCPGGPHRLADGREAIRALSWAQIGRIAKTLARLKPVGLDVPEPLLKIEKENFVPGTKQRVQLYGLALAAKRYALFEKLPGNRIRFRKRTEIGLALYTSPMSRPRLNPNDPYPHDHGWIAEVWRRFVYRALGWKVGRTPDWFRHPALQQLSLTDPDYLVAIEAAQPAAQRVDYVNRVKPFGFMSASQPANQAVLPTGVDPKRFRPIAPYSKNSADCLTRAWVDLYSWRPIAVTTRPGEAGGLLRLKTVGEVLRDYHDHPEAKCLGPDGKVCRGTTRGLLSPRPVIAQSIRAMGKESHKLESVEEGMEAEWAEVQQVYEPTGMTTWRTHVQPALDNLTTDAAVKSFAAKAGVAARTIWRLKKGARPSPQIQRRIRELVEIMRDSNRRAR